MFYLGLLDYVQLREELQYVRLVLVLSQRKITLAYEEQRSSGNPEVSQTHLAIYISYYFTTSIV